MYSYNETTIMLQLTSLITNNNNNIVFIFWSHHGSPSAILRYKYKIDNPHYKPQGGRSCRWDRMNWSSLVKYSRKQLFLSQIQYIFILISVTYRGLRVIIPWDRYADAQMSIAHLLYKTGKFRKILSKKYSQ